MNDLFEMQSSALASPPLSAAGPREDERPGMRTVALSPEFRALAARFSKIETSIGHTEMREPWVSPDRTVSLLRVLTPQFPNAWERCRISEMVDVCPAKYLIDLAGSRDLAEKIADALRFPVGALN